MLLLKVSGGNCGKDGGEPLSCDTPGIRAPLGLILTPLGVILAPLGLLFETLATDGRAGGFWTSDKAPPGLLFKTLATDGRAGGFWTSDKDFLDLDLS